MTLSSDSSPVMVKNSPPSSAQKSNPQQHRLPLEKIVQAVRIYEVAKETPLSFAPVLSEKTGNKCYLKREDLQPVFSFKIRGAFNKMVLMTPEQRLKGATACSAGNHAQGVAFSARHLGMSAKIFMPVITPTIKVNAVRRLGAEVILTGNTYDDAAAACKQCVIDEGRVLVHPFDDLDVIAGQGTIGLEILKQHPEKIDAVFVCIGGGGLVAGVGSCIKAVAPHVKIIGVEAADAAGMTYSLQQGQVSSLPCVGTFADGAAVKTVGSNNFDICYKGELIDQMITCSTDEICGAVKDAFTDVRVVLEPAGALAVAGMRKYIRDNNVQGQSFIAILSGANTDFNRLRFISNRADTSEHLMALVIPEKKGIFRKMYNLIYPRCVCEFSYRISHPANDDIKQQGTAHVLLSYRGTEESLTDEEDFKKVKASLEGEGFMVTDLNNCELSKVHGRHLVGGRSSDAENEVLLRFEYPERPGSLKGFLDTLPDKWNVSLFHYRNHGADVGRVLAGLQVPETDNKELEVFLDQLRAQGYCVKNETENRFYQLFLKSC